MSIDVGTEKRQHTSAYKIRLRELKKPLHNQPFQNLNGTNKFAVVHVVPSFAVLSVIGSPALGDSHPSLKVLDSIDSKAKPAICRSTLRLQGFGIGGDV